MNELIEQYRESVRILKEKLRVAQSDLECLIQQCALNGHKWGKVISDHIHEPSHVIRGDRPGDPGYGGVDRQFDCYVDAKTTYRWKRVCNNCGEIQYTTNTEKQVTEIPKF